jgi:tRNA-binding protein
MAAVPTLAALPAALPAPLDAQIITDLDIRIGTILAVEAVPNSKKLYDLTIDVGESVPRHLLVAWRRYYQPEELRDQQLPICCNVAWREMAGVVSQGRALTTFDSQGVPQLLIPRKPTDPGTRAW